MRCREAIQVLREWDTGVCWFVADNQGGPCGEVWAEERHLWCSACVAAHVLAFTKSVTTENR